MDLLLLLLFLSLSLFQIACLDDLGSRRLVPTKIADAGHEHGDLLLVLRILSVLARRDHFGKPSRSLEKHD